MSEISAKFYYLLLYSFTDLSGLELKISRKFYKLTEIFWFPHLTARSMYTGIGIGGIFLQELYITIYEQNKCIFTHFQISQSKINCIRQKAGEEINKYLFVFFKSIFNKKRNLEAVSFEFWHSSSILFIPKPIHTSDVYDIF